MRSLVAVLLVCLAVVDCLPADGMAALRPDGARRIRQKTRTVTVTETVMRTERLKSTVCARLINVTAPCKMPSNRELAVGEEPVILTFDDDMDQYDSIDALAHIRPSETLAVETTIAPTGFDENRDAVYRLEASFEDRAHEDSMSKPRTFLVGTVIFRETIRITSTVSLPPSETKTVFFMNCTPTPFTALSICLSKKRNAD